MRYPNIELLEYKFKRKIEESYPGIFDHYYADMHVDVFTQLWGSTALGFGGCGGSAMTKAFTTVFQAILQKRSATSLNEIEDIPEFHAVFFEDRLAYMITGEPTEAFYKDLRERMMAPVASAKERYCSA